ncbi:hypothetical protein STENM223S_00914 [Streptomyces tendae]
MNEERPGAVLAGCLDDDLELGGLSLGQVQGGFEGELFDAVRAGTGGHRGPEFEEGRRRQDHVSVDRVVGEPRVGFGVDPAAEHRVPPVREIHGRVQKGVPGPVGPCGPSLGPLPGGQPVAVVPEGSGQVGRGRPWEERGPIDARAVDVSRGQSGCEHVGLGMPGAQQGHGRQGAVVLPVADHPGEYGVGADFEAQADAFVLHGSDGVVEADGATQLTDPVLGIGQLTRPRHRTRDSGHQRHHRITQPKPAHHPRNSSSTPSMCDE